MPRDPITTLEGFRQLEKGWDSYGGEPIADLPIALARVMLGPPQVVPTSEGGVQLEWHARGFDVELEIHPSGRIEALFGRADGCDGRCVPPEEKRVGLPDGVRQQLGSNLNELKRISDAKATALPSLLEEREEPKEST